MRKFLAILAFLGLLATLPAAAAESGSLFVNLTSNDTHRPDTEQSEHHSSPDRGTVHGVRGPRPAHPHNPVERQERYSGFG